jgi:hypothetical protein
MSSKTYKRTSGYRNWVNSRRLLPILREIGSGPHMGHLLAEMSCGRQYIAFVDGWRRVPGT